MYEWSFGDGTTSTEQNPTHQYSAAGSYNISLTVTDLNEDSDVITKLDFITVIPDLVVIANFTANATSIIQWQSVEFTFTGDSGNLPSGYEWHFGDGGTSTDLNPTHQYVTNGTFTVTLTVTDTDGDSDTEIKTGYITVELASVPSANFTANVTNLVASQWVNFTYTGYGGNAPLTFAWDFGDDETSTDRNPAHQYAAAGTYTVTLVVTDADYDFDTEIKTSYVMVDIDMVPSITFTANATSVFASEWIIFTYAGSGGNAPLTFFWDFGDGGTSTDQNPTHQYIDAGTYTVTLKITDTDGDSGTETKTSYVIVKVPPSDDDDPTGPLPIDISTIVLIACVGSIVAIPIASLTYHFKKPTRRARKLNKKKWIKTARIIPGREKARYYGVLLNPPRKS